MLNMIGAKKGHTLAKGIDILLMFIVNCAHSGNLTTFYGNKYTDTVETIPHTIR